MNALMKTRQWLVVIGLFALIAVAIVGLVLTRESAAPTSQKRSRRPPLVDEKPLRTARSIAALASSREEQRFAQQALKLADHEVDLAFSGAMREASEHPPQPTPETKELFARKDKAQAQVEADQNRIEELKKQLAAAKGAKAEDLQEQIDLTQAQLELDRDELEDAQGDLSRSGADPLSRIQRQFTRHQASEQENGSDHAAQPPATAGTVNTSPATDNLIGQITVWTTLRRKSVQLEQARDQSAEAATTLKQTHDSLEQRLEAEKTSKPVTTGPAPSGPANASPGKPSAAAIVALRRLSDDQKNIADFGKRIQDHQELADVYNNWITSVQTRQQAAIHSMIRSALLILLIGLAVYLGSRLIDRFFSDLTADRKRLRTLRVVIRFVLQAIGVLLALFVLFGTPEQMPTILGLAGAGLTVALKDFIVGFFGWFVLMGRNGMRVGDWVEINGVVGEVAEIGLLRTVLLETGNWNDAGHPTGRKVAFVNSFAIEGHYFNFSTSGQWLWDELQVLVPVSENPYPLIDAIQKVVTDETAENAHMAEEEWRHASSRPRLQSLSAAPAVNVRPTPSGVQVLVRYITHAHERYETKSRLYHAVVELLHRRKDSQAMVGNVGENSSPT